MALIGPALCLVIGLEPIHTLQTLSGNQRVTLQTLASAVITLCYQSAAIATIIHVALVAAQALQSRVHQACHTSLWAFLALVLTAAR